MMLQRGSAWCTPMFQYPTGVYVSQRWMQRGPWYIRVSRYHPITHISISLEGYPHGEAACKICRVVTRIYKAVANNKVVKGNIDTKEISIHQEVATENRHPWRNVLNQYRQPLLFSRGVHTVRPDLGGVHVYGNITDHI